MGERRKRKSLWDKEAETKPFPGTSDNNSWTGKDQHPSQDGEHYLENSASGSHGAPNFRDHSGQPSLGSIEKDPVAQMNGSFNKSRENAPEGKERGGENSYNQNTPSNLKYNQDQTHSRRYQGRGRSSSRSRSRSKGRRRSRSLSGDMDRKRARGRSRSRSRSRSPIGDHKHQFSGWSDRRSQPEKLTELCSDFSAGRCRRGSQCKYLHPKDTSHRDGGADTSGSWKRRADHSDDSKHSYGRVPRTELKGDLSESYHAEDEQFQNNNKNAVPCKNFVKGKCRWGDTCRFSHHFASVGTSVEGTKHLSSDKDTELQPNRSRKLLCKYFAAGKCDWDDCRFSHEDSKFNSLEAGHGKVIDDRGSRDKLNRMNDSTWGDPGSPVENSNAGYDNRWNDNMGNENINRGIVQQTDNLKDNNNEHARRADSGSYGGDFGTAGSLSKELQNQERNLNVQGQNNFQVDQKLSANAWQQNVSPVSHIQKQNHGVGEITSFHSDIIDEVKGLNDANGPVLVPGQNMHQNATQISGLSDASQSNFMTSEHFAQYRSSPPSIAPMVNPVTYPDKIFENEHSGKNAAAEACSSTGTLVSVCNAPSHLLVDGIANIQSNPAGVSNDPINPMENDGRNNDHGMHTEKVNKIRAGKLSPSRTVGIGSNNSQVDHSGRPKLQQEAAPENPELDEVKRGSAEQSKGVENSMQTLDGHGKGEEMIANKDDKEMRLFKNSLIEFVKDILKPTWKEGRMSREVHKTIVKKVVDKILSTIQTDHIPKTQEKVEQYLSFSKLKIAKLVQAYVDRCLKPDS